VYARGGSLLAVPFDLQRLEVTGQPVEVVSGVMMSPSGGGAEFALSDTGTLVYAPGLSRTQDRRLVWVDRQGRREPLIDQPGAFTALALSPDGRSLAVQRQGGLETIVIYDIDRGTSTHWTSEWDNASPVWSPTGRDIVFTSARGSSWDLYMGPVDHGKAAERVATSGDTKVPTSWSPDGTVVTFHTSSPDTGQDIFVLSLNGERKPQPLVAGRANESLATFSPDGRWIAYQSDETGRNEIYLCRFPGCSGKQPVSRDGGTYPRWNPAGKELFYRNGDKMMTVSFAMAGDALTLGAPSMLFERRYGPTAMSDRFDVSPDGKRFVDFDDSVAEPPATHLVLVHNFGEELKRRVPARK
jgi:Tol biopolymer transport system component